MTEKRRTFVDLLPKLPGWIIGFVTFVSAVVGFVKLWQGDRGLVTVVLFAVGVIGALACFLYVAFKRTEPLVVGGKVAWQYPRWRRWALAGVAIILLLTAVGTGFYFYHQAQPPTKVILLVSNFEGPEPQKYRVTETVLARLRQALEPYRDVEIQALGRAITEAEGSAVARAEGQKRKAAIVLWGWYGVTADVVPLSVHFEVLRPPQYMPVLGTEAKGVVRTLALAELESFSLQTRLSTEMAYLSLFTVGMTRFAAEDWDGAVACFTDALSQAAERVPALDQSVVYYYRGSARAFKGEYDRAIADFDKAIQLQPEFALAYLNRGGAYYYKGNYDRAIADCDQAVRLQPDFAMAYRNRGLAYFSKGSYDRAVADYDQVLQLQPDDAEAYNNRGIAYAAKGDYDRAITDYGRAIQLQPSLTEAYLNRGVAYASKGDYERAIADFDQAIQLQPGDALAYDNRGLAYADKGDYDRAIADFDRAIQLQPDLAQAYNNRGLAYTAKGDYDRAIADFGQAIQLQPSDVKAYSYRGLAYATKGDLDHAVADFDQAVQLQPDFAPAYYARGLARRQKGEKEKAIADFQKVLQLSSDPWLREHAEEQLKALGAK